MQEEDKHRDAGMHPCADKGIRKERFFRFFIMLAMLAITTLFNVFLESFIQPSSLVFVYLVPAIAGTVYFGTWAGVFAFTAGFFIFDFLFVEPYYTLHISNPQDVYNVIVYFIVAVIITYLINRVRRQNIYLKSRLDRVSLAEDMSRDSLMLMPLEQTYAAHIAPSLRKSAFRQLGQLTLRYVNMILDAPSVVSFRDDGGGLKTWVKSNVDLKMTEDDLAAAMWAFDNGEVSGAGTYTDSETPFYFIPLKSVEGVIGVMGVLYNAKDLFPEQRRLLGTVANLTTIVAAMWLNIPSQA